MLFACLVYDDAAAFAPMSEAEKEGWVNAALDSDDALRRGGHYVESNALEHPSTAVSVRVRGGKVTATDGPFAETREHLGGYIIIEARDREEAVAIAATIPQAQLGTIEVRPVRLLERR